LRKTQTRPIENSTSSPRRCPSTTTGVLKDGDIEAGVAHEVKSPFEPRKYLENTMRFTVTNLCEEIFEKACEQLKRIESERKITISPEVTKEWQL
jgi:hypothetical protein